MLNPHPWPERNRDDLAQQALLYSSGELTEAEAADFEARLAVDQEARELLAQTVHLSMTAAGERCLPSPQWRAEACRRLRPRGSIWQRLSGKRVYRGHPVVWSLFGALAASVVFMLFSPAPQPPQAKAEPAPQLPPAEVARHWAELQTSDHLTKAHNDAARKKMRAEDRTRLAHSEERRLPRTGSPAVKPH